jgi:hypothetical protein
MTSQFFTRQSIGNFIFYETSMIKLRLKIHVTDKESPWIIFNSNQPVNFIKKHGTSKGMLNQSLTNRKKNFTKKIKGGWGSTEAQLLV